MAGARTGDGSDPVDTVAVTFQLNMEGVTTSAGVSLMGGAIFQQAGLAMSDDDGDNIWTVTADLPVNTTVAFKYRNTTALTWDGQESVPAECSFGEWGDRQVDVVTDDITLEVVAWGSCTSSPASVGDTASVTFQLNMSGVDTSNGVSLMGGAIFGQVGLNMSDDDGDNIWTVTAALPVDTTVAFKYRNTTQTTWDNQESVVGDCAYGTWGDRQVDVGTDDITLDVVGWGSCTSTPVTDAGSGDTGDTGSGDTGSGSDDELPAPDAGVFADTFGGSALQMVEFTHSQRVLRLGLACE